MGLVAAVTVLVAAGCRDGGGEGGGAEIVLTARAPGTAHTGRVLIRRPAPPVVEVTSAEGTTAPVACSTCHASREGDVAVRGGEDLERFHRGLEVEHGQLACLACHHDDDYDRLRLATGAALEFGDVIELCGQCHGPQYRDYRNGSHGGMRGYWDLSLGDRQRNVCTDCHDPHAPAFPQVHPAPPPRDRFQLGAGRGGHDHE
jgi:hypothetical protein